VSFGVTLCPYTLRIYTIIWTIFTYVWASEGYTLFIYTLYLHYFINNFYIDMYPCGLHFVHIYSIFTLISEQFYIFMEPWGLHFVHIPPVFTLISEQFLHRHGSFLGYVMSIYSLYLHYHLNNFYIYVYLWGLYLVHISFYSWHYLNNFYIDYPLVVTLCSYVLCIYTIDWTIFT
jgi:hypothetical protein